MENSEKSIIGIVVCKLPSKYIVWSNETYVGMDGHIVAPRDENVEPGDWVTVNFTKQEADLYFPSVKSPQTPRFVSRNFHLIPELYETKVEERTVRVSFDYIISVDQWVIEHHFFGNIYNNMRLSTENGLRKLTIRRVEPDGKRDSVWVLERIDQPEVHSETEKRVIGIVASKNPQMPNLVYVWCKETVSERDVTIEFAREADILKPGTWIQMEFTSSEYSTYFTLNNTSWIRCAKYSVMDPIHKTIVFENTIGLELECYIEGCNFVKDIWHPFVGVIINQTGPILQSGEYLIEITRGKRKMSRDGLTTSVWFVKKIMKKSAAIPAPPHDRNTPSFSQELVEPHVYQQMVNAAAPSQIAQLFNQIRLQHGDFPEAYENIPREPAVPIPPPPPPHVSKRHLAMITRIQKSEDYNFERVFLWLLDDHKIAILKLSVPVEKLELKEGSIFEADFIHYGDGKISSTGPIQKQNDPSYQTKKEPHGVQVRIYSEMYYGIDREHRWPRIWHDHFGNVYDNLQKLCQTNASIKRHVWIKRAKIGNEVHWVIVEEIL